VALGHAFKHPRHHSQLFSSKALEEIHGPPVLEKDEVIPAIRINGDGLSLDASSKDLF
jgi:hypothetical protein